MTISERGQERPDPLWLLNKAARVASEEWEKTRPRWEQEILGVVDSAWSKQFGDDVEPELPIEDPVHFIVAAIEEITHIVNNNTQPSGAINFSTRALATDTDKSKGFSVNILGRSHYIKGKQETFELVRNGSPKVPHMVKNHDVYFTYCKQRGICYLLVDTERFPQATQFEPLQQAEGVMIRSGGRISVNAPLTALGPNTLGFLSSMMQEAVKEFRRLSSCR